MAGMLVVIAVAEHDGESVFALNQIIGNVIFHAIYSVAEFIGDFIIKLGQVTLRIIRCVRNKQIVADFFAVYEKLEKSEAADDNPSLFALFCIKCFSENRCFRRSGAFNPFCVLEHAVMCHFISPSALRALNSSVPIRP